MNKAIGFFTNRYIMAAVGFLFVLGIVRRVTGR